MNAHADRHWERDQVDIFLFAAGPHARRFYTLNVDGTFAVTEVEPGEKAPPFLSLPTDAATALAKALSTLPGADDATVRHLDDAIQVRDRLLALVERP